MNRQPRLFVYPKDVEAISGKSYRTSRLLLSKIKKKLGKSSDQPVTITEFADYIGCEVETIADFFR